RVFAEIARAKPRQLLVIADGPRADHPGEGEKCAATRAVIERVDWDCQVLTNYSDVNLGCKRRVASGLSWVFEQVDQAIVLEDDCLPHPTFFRYCEDLLERYRDDERIMHIGGNNFQLGRRRTQDSYYFSRFMHSWGWGSWRRAWQFFDADLRQWPEVKDTGRLKDILGSSGSVAYWTRNLQQLYKGRVDTWDVQWMFAIWMQGGLCIMPNVNLVSNIGFQSTATHTNKIYWYANMPTEPMTFPMCHPSVVVQDAKADTFTQRVLFGSNLFERGIGKASRLWRSYQRGRQQRDKS
ncbi:MAG: glycosyltransferase family 2 protein, partial [Chloroflexota bacterium]|nr:glycosyltransferase family 2 protein [Chloroflexota bacterium]